MRWATRRLAHLSCFNVTALERTLAVRLGIPLYGCDPSLLYLGGKSGSRAAFREAGIPLPDGREDLRERRGRGRCAGRAQGAQPVAAACRAEAERRFLRRRQRGVLLRGLRRRATSAAGSTAHLPLNLAFEARDMRWERFAAKIAESGGIVEEWIAGDGVRSPSVQLRITPLGDLEIISTHDQILGGPSGQVFQACTFPADRGLRAQIQSLALRVGEAAAGEGRARPLRGRFRVGAGRGRLAALRHRDQPAQGRHDAHVPDAAVPDAAAATTPGAPSS